MSGSWPEPPDFALWRICRGGRGRKKSVCRIRDGVIEHWPSVAEAAKALHTSRDSIDERIQEEHTDTERATWWETVDSYTL